MRRSIIFIASVIVLAFAAAALPAQSLLDNEYYQKAQALKAQSDTALAAGDYDAATALAAEAKAELAKSDAYVEDMLGRYRANGWLQRAAERLAEAKSAGVPGYAKEPYDEASGDLDMAWAAYDGAAYEDSIDFAKRSIDTLDAIPAPQAVTVVKPVVEPIVETVTVQTESLILPGAYTVQLRQPLRDCLWRIAGFPFVYNNPWKWKVLWEANRDILIDPNNPDLVEIGQVLTIPSIAGEAREGTYDPALGYPTFGK